MASKRATIYLDPQLHKILKMKAAETAQTISDIVNEAIRHELAEDATDLAEIEKRAKEPSISFEQMLKELKQNGKI